MRYSKALTARGQMAHTPDEDLDFNRRAPKSRAYCLFTITPEHVR